MAGAIIATLLTALVSLVIACLMVRTERKGGGDTD